MTAIYKTLAQLKPNATTLTDAYTVPASTSATISSIVVCNTNATSSSFRVSIATAAASDDRKQYIYYDLPILANDTFIATIGVTLATTDVVRVYAADTLVAFNIFGVEII